MISVKKFWTIVIALSLSLFAYADTYYLQGVKQKDANDKEYLIFTDEHKVQLGFKAYGFNLASIKDSKTDSIAKQKKIDEEAEKEKKSVANIQNFVNNLLKLSITLIGMVAIFLIVSILCAMIWIIVADSTIYKKS